MQRMKRAEYVVIHSWLRDNYDKERCESKDCEGNSSRLEWALKTGKTHAKNRENYLVLCKPCHFSYDKKHQNISHVESDDRANIKLPIGLLLKIKSAAKKNNRKIIDEIRHRFTITP